jgi:hypothetical protein
MHMLVALLLAALTGGPAGAPADFRFAFADAETNLQTREGAAYDVVIRHEFGETRGSAVGTCVDRNANDGPIEPFDLLMRIGRGGAVETMLVYPRTEIAHCVALAASHDRHTRPPRAHYWVRVHVVLKN